MGIHSIEGIIKEDPYKLYMYSYPHKTSYYSFPPVRLKKQWADENKDSLFLYLHIPFCRKKCGFCNLLSIDHASDEMITRYIDTMEMEAEAAGEILGDFSFSLCAVGGGTPTILDVHQLRRVFRILEEKLHIDLSAAPLSIEVSPITVDPPKLLLLKEKQISRVSVGVQSFHEDDIAMLGRYQQTKFLFHILENLKEVDFPVLNLDLIYGIPGQTEKRWCSSLETAAAFSPEEIYIYPFYYREYTLMASLHPGAAAIMDKKNMLRYYEIARDFLLSRGYRQSSMRKFYRPGPGEKSPGNYSCQEDGMISLGCGARSYTRDLHYSSRYSVSHPGVTGIINDYIKKSRESFYYADYGCVLNREEQRRRFIIKSLFKMEGLDKKRYTHFFHSLPEEDFIIIGILSDLGYLVEGDERIVLTEKGMTYSDAIGPLFISREVKERMKAYVFA